MSTRSQRSVHDLSTQGFHDVGAASEVRGVMPKRVLVENRGVLVCRQGDELHAVDELCPHKYKSMAYGLVHGGKIVCPHHQYGFDLRSGRCDKRRCAPINVYELVVDADDRVWVRVRPPAAVAASER
ncbi:MAG: Rieske 2Fe-2S domain-containing protein [Myxococcota bacterium]